MFMIGPPVNGILLGGFLLVGQLEPSVKSTGAAAVKTNQRQHTSFAAFAKELASCLPGAHLLFDYHQHFRSPDFRSIEKVVSSRFQPPRPLPNAVTQQKAKTVGKETAALQRTYRKLKELGLDDEAREIAMLLQSPAAEDRVVQAQAIESLPIQPVNHMSYRAAKPIEGVFAGTRPVPWSQAKNNLLSCQFENVPLDEVAKFLHQATGTSIKLEVGEQPLPAVTVSARDQTAQAILDSIAASSGWNYTFDNKQIVFAAPMVVSIRDSAAPIRR